MNVTKNQTQVRAEIGWLWERETNDVRQTDSGQVLFKEYKVDVRHNRIESAWHKTDWELSAGNSASIELDYLTRPTVGGTLDIGFLDVRALLVVNNGPGKLVIQPGESCGWSEPWKSNNGVNVVPPNGAVLFSAGDVPWSVTIIANTLTFEAQDDKCLFDVAVIGKTGDIPMSDSSTSSSSSSCSGSSSSFESVNE